MSGNIYPKKAAPKNSFAPGVDATGDGKEKSTTIQNGSFCFRINAIRSMCVAAAGIKPPEHITITPNGMNTAEKFAQIQAR